MNDSETSNIILIDADSFNATPKSSDKAMRNAFMIEFCVKATENGYKISILYSNQKRGISSQHARNTAIQGIKQGILSHNNISRHPPTNPNFLIDRLVPYSEYAQSREHAALDDVAMVISPHRRSNMGLKNSFSMLIENYGAYIHSSQINDFAAFQTFNRDLNADKTRTTQAKSTAVQSALQRLDQIRNAITLEATFQDNANYIMEGMLEAPEIVALLANAPENVPKYNEDGKTSKEQVALTSYFTALLRFERYERNAKKAGITDETKSSALRQEIVEKFTQLAAIPNAAKAADFITATVNLNGQTAAQPRPKT